ncbi:type II secretion system F family protein [Pseudooceanicola sp. LIPI14-2-Ac024]|uniref:type II secretion system F family protein n=1 Tax=Pseudooceanicola sp. LIPI14-2-Ac024 TaxID=3344875 RepID=UPI0035CFA064
MEQLTATLAAAGITTDPRLLIQVLVAVGLFIAVLGIGAAVRSGPTPQQRRIRAGAPDGMVDSQIIRPWDNDPTGALRLFVPRSGKERGKIALRLRQAGFHGGGAVRTYFIVRTALAFALPAVFVWLAWFGTSLPNAAARIVEPVSRLETTQVFLLAVGLVVAGFYGPSLWLRQKVDARRTAISRGLPGALDLLQVAIEAGLGFDAAMTRVAHEIARFCPPIADEFTILQLEIHAGKPRDRAFAELERRTGVEEMASFANVIQQATEFGTPVSQALETYATEMRNDRELKAQAKANQLPVKMSGVLAGCMMPVLLLIMLTPIAIRWVTVM